jgi:hypothetical protein
VGVVVPPVVVEALAVAAEALAEAEAEAHAVEGGARPS